MKLHRKFSRGEVVVYKGLRTSPWYGEKVEVDRYTSPTRVRVYLVSNGAGFTCREDSLERENVWTAI